MATIKDNAKILEILTSLSKQRGFVFQSSEIYGGLGSTWDYGPLGIELKRNIKNLWWKDMITSRNNIVGMDSSILMHPKVWEASGHIDNFHDLDRREAMTFIPCIILALPLNLFPINIQIVGMRFLLRLQHTISLSFWYFVQEYYLPDVIPIPFNIEVILVLVGVYYGFSKTINELVDETLEKQGFI